jgi:broad specificity phosphatase PhoE
MPDVTVVHLLRHGEVDNPRGVLYGRLPGFHLSAEGEHMAKAAAAFLAGRDVTLVLSSPLERAQETAAPVAAQFGLEVRVDERLLEPWNAFEGERFDVGFSALLRPRTLPRVVNPFRPSWGEPYTSVAARMRAVMDDAAREAHGHEAVCVSHQLPIWVARRSAEGRRLWHHPSNRECALGSVTSFTYRDGAITGVSYADPAGAGRGRARGA